MIRYESANGEHTIGISEFIDADVRDRFENELDIPIGDYLGAEVLKINGKGIGRRIA